VSLPAFVNEPLLELRRHEERDELLEALQTLDQRLPLRVPMLIGEQAIEGEELRSTDPGEPERLVALAPKASPDDVARALELAAGSDWAQTPLSQRVQALRGAAEWMRPRRRELAALCVRECAKPWADADADVAEAIDFLEYYALSALELDGRAAVAQLPGERNWMSHHARGVCAVIAPWNFPLAIPCGMLSAALVTGNAAVLKPAEQSPACGSAVVAALRAGGVPPAALGLLHGEGDVGAALVADPRVDVVAFTGSADVGLEIVRSAGQPAAGQRHFKRVVAETGGKNCIVVDSDADLDEAVPAIVQSAFGYAGQKCSAASRILAHEAIAATLFERLAGAVATLQVGQAEDFASDLGPVIDREAQARVERYALIAEKQGRILVHHPGGLPERGWFCAPLLAGELPPDSPVLSDEIFGPLLSVETVSGVTEALERIEQLPFALTGGLFSRNPRTIERFVARSPVGNLYINRQITGAMVGRQPFGGNRMSGTGAKAGGPDYLLQFVESQAVSENVVRHGLVELGGPEH
jgi:RHH-type transcriptional regulator, proline utilization regulon repressor / proline dehydrogenase / delta 1-pyrroline-5-carboxylate dehydrogenase